MKLALCFCLVTFGLAGTVSADTVPADTASADTARPNIVFVFSDDHSIQTIGAYGSRLSEFCRQHSVTPNIDQVAGEGAVFVNSFCGNSLCSPSRASILTGLHSHANGVMTLGKPITPGLWTYPQGLREAGYKTAVFGKWHLGDTRPAFDDWLILPGQGQYNDPHFDGPDGPKSFEGYTTDVITDLSLEWLGKRDRSKPFFLAVHHKAPHRNFMPPERYADFLEDVKVPEPDTLFDDYAHRASPARNQEMSIAKDMRLDNDLKLSPAFAKNPMFTKRNEEFSRIRLSPEGLVRWKYQLYLKDYLRCVKAVDDSVGRIRETLKAEGIDDKTILIYSSDQGFYMGEHGWFDKRWIYEESLHMPFIMRWPGVVKPGTRINEFIQNKDYAPTFVELAGGTVPAGLHGRSFVSVLRGQTPDDWQQSVYYRYYDRGHGVAAHQGVRTQQYTLAHFPATNEWELFDLETDPKQLNSVYDDPAMASTVTELKAELERLQTKFKDDPSVGTGAESRKAANPRKGKMRKKDAA